MRWTKTITFLLIGLASVRAFAAQGVETVTYSGNDGVKLQLFDVNSVASCTGCHYAGNGGGQVPLDNYSDANSVHDLAYSYVNSGYMPYLLADLNGTEKTFLNQWAVGMNAVNGDGDDAPNYVAPYVNTTTESTTTKYSIIMRALINENGNNSTASFDFGTTNGGPYPNNEAGNTPNVAGDGGGGGSSSTVTHSSTISDLACGTNYYYRARATNGAAQTTVDLASNDQLAATLACPILSAISDIVQSEDSNVSGPTLTTNKTSETASFSLQVAPAGMTVNSANGQISWLAASTPDTSTINTDYPVTVRATFTNGSSPSSFSDQSFTVTITPVNDAPTTSSIANQGTLEDTATSAIAFTIGDVDTAVGSLTLSASSSNTTLLPVSNIVFGGSGANRTVTMTPALDQTGSSNVTISIFDGAATTNMPVFSLTVTPVSDPPTISDTSNQSAVNEDNAVSIAAITVGDDLTAAASLVLVGSSSNTTLVPNSNIVFGGSGASRTATITPASNQNGSATITVTVWDGSGIGLGLSITDTFTVTFNAVNDSPTLTPISNQAVTELSPFGLTVTPSDVDDVNDGSGALSFALAGQPSGMTISNVGAISYTPGQDTAAVFNVTVTVTDGGENGSTAAVQSFTLTVNKLDGDVDTIADYHDNCPATANTDQLNTDGDAQGNVCDTDDDNDLIPDTVELAKGMNPLDAADAAGDLDGDGLTNLAEYQTCVANSDATCNAMLVDSVDPVITTNGDLVVPSTGYVTAGGETASASDGIDGDIPVTADVHGPYRPGRYIVTWTAEDAANNVATVDQQIDVLPLVQIDTNLLVGENNQVKVPVRMNGVAPTYPVDIQYTISGSASGADHTAVNGTLSIASGDSGLIEFSTSADSASEADETVVITLSSVSTNAVLSSDKIATITIVDRQAPPSVALEVEQNAIVTQQLFSNSGTVTLRAIATDPNGGNLSYSWGETSNTLAISVNNNIATFNPLALAAGSYHVAVAVSDGLVTVKRETTVTIAASAPTLSNVNDTDGDGVDDQTEGLVDSDGDGVSDYRDPVNAVDLLNISNDDANDRFDRLIKTESGLQLSLGTRALAANHIGARISSVDIKDSNGNVINDGTFQLTGELFDFNVTGLNDVHKQAVIVIPLKSAILPDSVYRKFIGGAWRAFDANNGDTIASSPLVEGKCPALENAAAWSSGVHASHRCLRLSITDGGSNDADGTVNGAVADPGGLAVAKSKAEPAAPTRSQTGSGEIAWWTLLMMAALLSVRQLKRQTRSVRVWK